MLPRAEDLDRGNAGLPDFIQPDGGQTMVDEEMRRENMLDLSGRQDAGKRGMTRAVTLSDFTMGAGRTPQVVHKARRTAFGANAVRVWGGNRGRRGGTCPLVAGWDRGLFHLLQFYQSWGEFEMV